uniref:Small integral membrane protein 3-like n=1 Tax=Steinernema glaseri TaxID=37863 RepID=A0A1I8A8J1_9BILA
MLLPQEECDTLCFINKHQVLLLIISFTVVMVLIISFLRLVETITEENIEEEPHCPDPPLVLCNHCYVQQPTLTKEWLL